MKLYTIHCPKCIVLETKLKQKNIKYEEIINEKDIESKGITDIPTLELDDGKRMTFVDANKFINSLEV